MNIPKEVLEIAIRGGWGVLGFDDFISWEYRAPIAKYRFILPEYNEDGTKDLTNTWHIDFSPEEIVCDPSFWFSLGKELGWDTNPPKDHVTFKEATGEDYWRYRAGWFFDLLMTFGSTEKFWTDLLAKR